MIHVIVHKHMNVLNLDQTCMQEKMLI